MLLRRLLLDPSPAPTDSHGGTPPSDLVAAGGPPPGNSPPAAGTPPPAAAIVVGGAVSESDAAAQRELEEARQKLKAREQRIAELEDENGRLKAIPAPAPKKSRWETLLG